MSHLEGLEEFLEKILLIYLGQIIYSFFTRKETAENYALYMATIRHLCKNLADP